MLSHCALSRLSKGSTSAKSWSTVPSPAASTWWSNFGWYEWDVRSLHVPCETHLRKDKYQKGLFKYYAEYEDCDSDAEIEEEKEEEKENETVPCCKSRCTLCLHSSLCVRVFALFSCYPLVTPSFAKQLRSAGTQPRRSWRASRQRSPSCRGKDLRSLRMRKRRRGPRNLPLTRRTLHVTVKFYMCMCLHLYKKLDMECETTVPCMHAGAQNFHQVWGLLAVQSFQAGRLASRSGMLCSGRWQRAGAEAPQFVRGSCCEGRESRRFI